MTNQTRTSRAHERLTLDLIRAAHERIVDKINRTPIVTSRTLNARAGMSLFFKCENFQKAGVFKARGAANAILSLSDAVAARGVATHSSGNHGAAVAWAARLRGIPAHVVVPKNAPKAKIAAVERYGGKITFCDTPAEIRERVADEVCADTGAELIHPYDDLRVMAGQGTTGIELLQDLADIDTIVCPVGGGGQLSGIAVAVKSLEPNIRVIGAEPAAADDAARSFRARRRLAYDGTPTIADGLRTSLGERTFVEICEYVDDIVTVSEAAIVDAMRTIWEVMKIIVEPSGAVAYAAVMNSGSMLQSERCAVVLSGGNLDLGALPWPATGGGLR